MAPETPSDFGPNEWLVDELYESYQADRDSVDPAWWDFFADYRPGESSEPDDEVLADAGTLTDVRTGQSRPAPAPPPPPGATAGDWGLSGSPRTWKPPGPVAPGTGRTGTEPVAPEGEPIQPPRGSGEANPDTPTSVPPQPGPFEPPREPDEAPPAPLGASMSNPKPMAAPESPGDADSSVLRGASARVVSNMDASLTIPTATSVRSVPSRLLEDNRVVINNHLRRGRGGKVSFTHVIGYAIVRALADLPAMNRSFARVDDKPTLVTPAHINFGLAIDLPKSDGTRQLLVPSIKGAERMDFAQFWATYEDLVRRARQGKLGVADFAGTTITLTNPGTIGTVHSVPRLMQGQGTIVGAGALNYPAQWQGASPESLARNAVSKVITLTSTYDHRVIQGAESGEFLKRIHELLIGQDGFYDEIFRSMRIPYVPIRWSRDNSTSHDTDLNKTARVQQIIHAFRVRGHLMADIDPLEYHQRTHPDLEVMSHQLSLWDLDREFATGGFGGKPLLHLREILGVLRDSYCRTTGIEYMHMQDPEQREWIQDRVEVPVERVPQEEQLRILRKLNQAEAFETFLHTKYVGQKRFSLEGGESSIPLIDAVMDAAAEDHLQEVCIGMPHRGRLNVLANLGGKSYGQIFQEFEGNYGLGSVQGSGDVKYHLGTSGEYKSLNGNTIDVYLAANPSHLEAVDPVLEGIVRAKQDQLPKADRYDVLPILMHGDAAFAGQGVVAETLHLSQLQGYRTGGTIHVIVNNQVGFTTSPQYSRSSVYSTDVARMIQAPILHVNGDDPEAVVHAAKLAYEYRKEFNRDVVIDMVCYRRRGHNEADDPSLTQPLMYSIIDRKRSVRKNYTEQLIGRGDITLEEAEGVLRHFQEELERVFQNTREALGAKESFNPTSAEVEREGTQHLKRQKPARDVNTAITQAQVDLVLEAQKTLPDGFTPHPRLVNQLKKRITMAQENRIDWGLGEALAFGSLVNEGRWVRLAGQDSRRGTFGHRHAVIVDKRTGWQFKPLKHCYSEGGRLYVYDSLLSEFAAMGFEYGYSVARPEALVMWEAQFGDFANGAQTILDEFISSGEQKWGQRSAVTLLLPHGYEGQGPDHSSARVERFLQMCAEDNMTIAMPTTPASYFHLLRWQVYSRLTRPLVIFTPKSLLRAKAATSSVEDFTTGTFRPLIDDPSLAGDDPRGGRPDIGRVLLCTGKVYYDLVAERSKRGITDTAIVRLERPYPLPVVSLPAMAKRYSSARVRWVQEEPANMGAWSFVSTNLPQRIGRPIEGVTRPLSASPAAGSHIRHDKEQRRLMDEAFAS